MSDRLKVVSNDEPWYHAGLNFKCTGCGQCCTGAPGYVWVSLKEVEEMADYLNISVKTFSIKYLRRTQGKMSLIERPKTYDCVFLNNNRCEIYPVRPLQCRTFPWWTKNLKSKDDWEEAAKTCEGINLEAPLVSFDEIEAQKCLHESQE